MSDGWPTSSALLGTVEPSGTLGRALARSSGGGWGRVGGRSDQCSRHHRGSAGHSSCCVLRVTQLCQISRVRHDLAQYARQVALAAPHVSTPGESPTTRPALCTSTIPAAAVPSFPTPPATKAATKCWYLRAEDTEAFETWRWALGAVGAGIGLGEAEGGHDDVNGDAADGPETRGAGGAGGGAALTSMRM